MSEILDLFEDDDSRREFLKKRLLSYTELGPSKLDSYRLVLQYRGKSTVIRKGAAMDSKTLIYNVIHPPLGVELTAGYLESQ